MTEITSLDKNRATSANDRQEKMRGLTTVKMTKSNMVKMKLKNFGKSKYNKNKEETEIITANDEV